MSSDTAYLFVVDLHVADLDLVGEPGVGALGHPVKQGVTEARNEAPRALAAHHCVRLARAWRRDRYTTRQMNTMTNIHKYVRHRLKQIVTPAIHVLRRHQM